MKWQQIDDWHLVAGEWSLTRPGRPDLLPLPYALYRNGRLVGNYPSSAAAKAAADGPSAA